MSANHPVSAAEQARAPHRVRAERPELRLVERPRHVGRGVAALMLVGAVGVFGVVGLSALAAESAFEAQRVAAEVEELTLRYDELTAEVAGLESPAHVRAMALTELGMVPAANPGFLTPTTGELPAAARGVPPPARADPRDGGGT